MMDTEAPLTRIMVVPHMMDMVALAIQDMVDLAIPDLAVVRIVLPPASKIH